MVHFIEKQSERLVVYEDPSAPSSPTIYLHIPSLIVYYHRYINLAQLEKVIDPALEGIFRGR